MSYRVQELRRKRKLGGNRVRSLEFQDVTFIGKVNEGNEVRESEKGSGCVDQKWKEVLHPTVIDSRCRSGHSVRQLTN